VYDAIFGRFDTVQPDRFPKLSILENVDEKYVDQLVTQLAKSPDYSELAFVVICKSGRTFETLKNLSHITQDKFRGMVTGANTYVVSVEGNHTWQWGQKLGAKLFPMPVIVSGRFSVFSAVGVIPLGLAGVDVTKFLEGAKGRVHAVDEVQKDVGTRFNLYTEGWDSDVYFAFDDRLKSLAEWMCSITAESLGKAGIGITPMTSVGSRDLHSIGQLYLQGRRDKVTTFLSLSDTDENNLSILDAVKKAYDDANLPYNHVRLECNTSETLACELGDFMQAWIIQTVLLGGLMNLNPFNQPGVELYKKYLQ
jgi:glucose-6-phosphate isomerase